LEFGVLYCSFEGSGVVEVYFEGGFVQKGGFWKNLVERIFI
jgi:hypothetical protein